LPVTTLLCRAAGTKGCEPAAVLYRGQQAEYALTPFASCKALGAE
jgi:hypothetical protein